MLRRDGQEDAIAQLRREISHLEGMQQTSLSNAVSTGIPALDAALPNGSLPRGVIHEFISHGPENTAASLGFSTALLGLLGSGGTAVWISKDQHVFPPGLSMFGIQPDKIIFINLRSEQQMLWAMEEALRCKGLTAAFIETPEANLTATRRLQLAAEDTGVTGFLLRANPRKSGSSSCVTSWCIKSAASVLSEGMPGVGFPRWQVELIKARNGRPGNWLIEWRQGQLCLVETKIEQLRQPRFSRVG